MIQPIPEAAMPVVEILRRDVPRPMTKPMSSSTLNGACFIETFKGVKFECCPMGLHPTSNKPAPDNPTQSVTVYGRKHIAALRDLLNELLTEEST